MFTLPFSIWQLFQCLCNSEYMRETFLKIKNNLKINSKSCFVQNNERNMGKYYRILCNHWSWLRSAGTTKQADITTANPLFQEYQRHSLLVTMRADKINSQWVSCITTNTWLTARVWSSQTFCLIFCTARLVLLSSALCWRNYFVYV